MSASEGRAVRARRRALLALLPSTTYRVVISHNGYFWQYWIYADDGRLLKEGTAYLGMLMCHARAAVAFCRLIRRNGLRNTNSFEYTVEVENPIQTG